MLETEKETEKEENSSPDLSADGKEHNSATLPIVDNILDTGAAKTAADANEIQREFSAVKDTLSKVPLTPELRLNEVTTGNFNKQDRQCAKLLRGNSRYIETALKLILVAGQDPELSGTGHHYLSQLDIVLRAAILFNQQEYQAVLVNGQFDDDTTRMFRMIQQNTNCFSPTTIDQLKLAAELSIINDRRSSAANTRGGRNQQWQRGASNYSYQRGRGGRFQSYRGRGFNQPPTHNPNNNWGPSQSDQ